MVEFKPAVCTVAFDRSQGAKLPTKTLHVRRKGCRRSKYEVLPFGMRQKVLWASDALLKPDAPYFPYFSTENAILDLQATDADPESPLVRQGDPFEIRVVGCSAVSSDFQFRPFFTNRNELVLYSVKDYERDSAKNIVGDMKVPRIHYHYKDVNTVKPDQYQEIPFSRSLMYQSDGSALPSSVSGRLKLIELDKKHESVRGVIDEVGNLPANLSDIGVAFPFATILGPVLKLAANMGTKALNEHAKPDHLLTADYGFQIAPRKKRDHDRPGAYLRYGYYYFLKDAVDKKLYASTNELNQTQLMVHKVRRSSGSRRSTSPGGINGQEVEEDRWEYVPLTGVSYVVIKVGKPVEGNSAGTSASPEARHPLETLRMLQRVLETAKETPAGKLKDDILAIVGESHSGSPDAGAVTEPTQSRRNATALMPSSENLDDLAANSPQAEADDLAAKG
jgi:hypothetical protein